MTPSMALMLVYLKGFLPENRSQISNHGPVEVGCIAAYTTTALPQDDFQSLIVIARALCAQNKPNVGINNNSCTLVGAWWVGTHGICYPI